MLLDSARGLKRSLLDTTLAPFTAADAPSKSFAVRAGPVSGLSPVQPSIALGIAPGTGHDFRLAVRCQRRELIDGKEIAEIRKKAKGEVDVRYIGRVSKLAGPWTRQRHRPLSIGVSVGHAKVTAGTLGAFVRRRDGTGGPLLLSNNHVLANENRGKVGDAIVQPGTLDDGADPADRVATLAGMVRLSKSKPNAVDAAVAALADGMKFDPRSVRGLGKLAGLGAAFVDLGTEVAKLGRTTGLTRGRVTAFEVDGVVVEFDTGSLRFDGQLEIEGAGDESFALGGDSGSLILEAGPRLAVALLFAVTDRGGTNDQGLTYANPVRTVLDALKVDLVLD